MGFELAVLLVVVAVVLVVWLRSGSAPSGRQRIQVAGEWRTYSVHRPPGAKNPPLLFCFHGGGGRVQRLERQSGITEAGLRHGFVVVFPEAPGGWIDARPERGGSERDIAFIEALLDRLRRTEGANAAFAIGVSNGGLFLFRMAMERPLRFAAFATLLASIPAAALRGRSEGPPVPVALVFGRDDPLMPWSGGRIPHGRRPGMGVGGIVVPAETTLDYWLTRNHARGTPIVRRTGGGDNPVEIRDYGPTTPAGAAVRFVAIDGWGHQWPRWPGDAPGDPGFDIADTIFEFFAAQSNGAPASDHKPVRLRLGGA